MNSFFQDLKYTLRGLRKSARPVAWSVAGLSFAEPDPGFESGRIQR
jgi:hypothetical protein